MFPHMEMNSRFLFLVFLAHGSLETYVADSGSAHAFGLLCHKMAYYMLHLVSEWLPQVTDAYLSIYYFATGNASLPSRRFSALSPPFLAIMQLCTCFPSVWKLRLTLSETGIRVLPYIDVDSCLTTS